jgi:hypothetical protein
VGGVCYVAHCSSRTLQAPPKPGEPVMLCSDTYVREDMKPSISHFGVEIAAVIGEKASMSDCHRARIVNSGHLQSQAKPFLGTLGGWIAMSRASSDYTDSGVQENCLGGFPEIAQTEVVGFGR